MLFGCASPAIKHSKYQQQIQQNTQRLTDDARDLLAVVHQTLKNTNTTNPDIQQDIDTLSKSQSLLGAKVDDGEEFKNLTKEQMQQAIDELYQQSQKIKELNEKLELKDQHVVDTIAAKHLGEEAVAKYKFWQNFKLYSVIGVVLTAIVTILYYVPASSVRVAISALSNKFNTKTPPTSGK